MTIADAAQGGLAWRDVPIYVAAQIAGAVAGVAAADAMWCGEACPVVAGVRRVDWALADPNGQAPEGVRVIRDEIRRRVVVLLGELGARR